MFVSKLLCAVLKIFCPLSLFSDWERLQYHTFRVAITFSTWLGFRNNLNGMQSLRLLLPCCLVNSSNHIFMAMHAIILQDSWSYIFCWVRTPSPSLAAQERKRKWEWHILLAFASMLHCSVVSHWRLVLSNAFVFTFPLLSLLLLSTK